MENYYYYDIFLYKALFITSMVANTNKKYERGKRKKKKTAYTHE